MVGKDGPSCICPKFLTSMREKSLVRQLKSKNGSSIYLKIIDTHAKRKTTRGPVHRSPLLERGTLMEYADFGQG